MLEGPDNVGKSTQAKKIQATLVDKPLFFWHFQNYKGFDSPEKTRNYSYDVYYKMFDILFENHNNSHFILDRSHIGETVYSPIYRGYSGDYIFDIEEKFYNNFPNFWKEIYLITFIDNVENLVKREDGLSFSVEAEKKIDEINRFVKASNDSWIENKLILNINGKNADMVFDEVKRFLGVNI